MKMNSRRLLLALLLSFFFCSSFAQQEEDQQTNDRSVPKWVSDKGYWVAESNRLEPGTCILSFYNNDNVLVYKEETRGLHLNFTKRKTLVKLRKLVDASVDSWEKMKSLESAKNLVANTFD